MKKNQKSTTVRRYVNTKTGETGVELTCQICGHCPCKHVRMINKGILVSGGSEVETINDYSS